MAGWAAAAQAGLQLADTWVQSSSAHKANRTNIQLQREQQKWEQMMSNTAIQRRVKDITEAGGNPALAFTGGQSASTPSVAPAHVEPTYKGGAAAAVSTAMMLKAQLDNMRANTASQSADARVKNVEAEIREGGKKQEFEARVNTNVEQVEWNDLKTKILRETVTSTAANAKKTRETVDAMIDKAKQDARSGQLNLEALENIAKVGGIEAGRMKDIIKLFLDYLLKD